MINERLLEELALKANLGKIIEVGSIHSGLINKTLKVKTARGSFAIQQINQSVFKNPVLIGHNEALLHSNSGELLVQLIAPINTSLWSLEDQFFRITRWEEELITVNVISQLTMAVSAAKLLGSFHIQTKHLELKSFHEIIPKFHDLGYRSDEFKEAYKNSITVNVEIDSLIVGLDDYAFLIDEYKEMTCKEAPIICHNDLKVSNILFDKIGEATKLIDLDTVMPGYACTDFGDLVRSACVSCSESETNIEMVVFNFPFLIPMLDSYVQQSGTSSKYLFKGVLFMFYIMSLRFLTDYLLGNKYYEINYPEENYIRARNQYILLDQANNYISKLRI